MSSKASRSKKSGAKPSSSKAASQAEKKADSPSPEPQPISDPLEKSAEHPPASDRAAKAKKTPKPPADPSSSSSAGQKADPSASADLKKADPSASGSKADQLADKAPRKASGAKADKKSATPQQFPAPTTFLGQLREFGEALALAFIVAMFFRTFVVELFRIPSGSMSPTLIGDYAAELDLDGNGEPEQIVVNESPRSVFGSSLNPRRFQVFYKRGGKYEGFDNFDEYGVHRDGIGRLTSLSETTMRKIESKAEPRFDRILVNKFHYWTRPKPDRGDIMVFKVPDTPINRFEPTKPIYIKRVAALEGERVEIANGDLYIDGQEVKQPAANDRIHYVTGDFRNGWYARNHGKPVPQGTFLAFGDNSTGSLDSRAWGPVPVESLKGVAIFRYFPFAKWGFVNGDL